MLKASKGNPGGGNGDEDAKEDDETGDAPSAPRANIGSTMPDDYSFVRMIAFFLWGFIVEDSMEPFKLKLFKIGSNEPIQTGSGNGRSKVRNEAMIQANAERDAGAPHCPGLPSHPTN